MKKKPVLGNRTSSAREIKVGAVPDQKKVPILLNKDFSAKFTFSFQYFKQIKFFEVGGVGNSWYISLIERLQELSKKNWQNFEKDFLEKKSLRYHEIDWNGINVPITRADLNWIDDYYLNNVEDFPIIQFHVSKALGRVVGFWDAYHVFQIVLLDPLHNIQPSNYNSYKVNDTYYMSCEYSSLMVDLIKIQKKILEGTVCEICSEINKLPSKLNETNMLIAHLADDYSDRFKQLNMTTDQVLEIGILNC